MQSETKMIKEGLLDLTMKSRVANYVLSNWAKRQRSRQSIQISAMYNRLREEGVSITRSELLILLRDLNAIGVGSLSGSHFNFNYTLRSVGGVVEGKDPVPFKDRVVARGVLKSGKLQEYTFERENVIIKIIPKQNMGLRDVLNIIEDLVQKELR